MTIQLPAACCFFSLVSHPIPHRNLQAWTQLTPHFQSSSLFSSLSSFTLPLLLWSNYCVGLWWLTCFSSSISCFPMLAMDTHLDAMNPFTVWRGLASSLWCKCGSGNQKLRQWWCSSFFSHVLAITSPFFFLFILWMMVSLIGFVHLGIIWNLWTLGFFNCFFCGFMNIRFQISVCRLAI